MSGFNQLGYDKIITYYKNELELKKREINNLKQQIVNLNKDKSIQNNKIEQLKFQNFKVKEGCDAKMNLSIFNQNISKSDYISHINKLSNEISELKKDCYTSSNKKNEEVFDYKELKLAYNELDMINHANTEIIERMQSFYNKMNILFNNKKNGIFVDYFKDTMEKFKFGLFKIENEIYEQYGIISKSQYDQAKKEKSPYKKKNALYNSMDNKLDTFHSIKY